MEKKLVRKIGLVAPELCKIKICVKMLPDKKEMYYICSQL